MYDEQLVCQDHGIIRRYDSNKRDYSNWKYCPICARQLKKEGYSPNI